MRYSFSKLKCKIKEIKKQLLNRVILTPKIRKKINKASNLFTNNSYSHNTWPGHFVCINMYSFIKSYYCIH